MRITGCLCFGSGRCPLRVRPSRSRFSLAAVLLAAFSSLPARREHSSAEAVVVVVLVVVVVVVAVVAVAVVVVVVS